MSQLHTHLRKIPVTAICRYVSDVNPYTQEPVQEKEIICIAYADSAKALAQAQAEHPSDQLWEEEDFIWE